jgi:hypothetical protein
MRLKYLFLSSLAVGAVSFMTPLIVEERSIGQWTPAHAESLKHAVAFSSSLAIAWFVLQGIAIAQHGRGGLLLIMGAPWALYWPLLYV